MFSNGKHTVVKQYVYLTGTQAGTFSSHTSQIRILIQSIKLKDASTVEKLQHSDGNKSTIQCLAEGSVRSPGPAHAAATDTEVQQALLGQKSPLIGTIKIVVSLLLTSRRSE